MQLTGDKPQPSGPSEADEPHSGGHSADAGPPGMNPWEDGFCTELKEYSGPLELLLYLIHRNEIEILDIPVAQVLEDDEDQGRKSPDVAVGDDGTVLLSWSTSLKDSALAWSSDGGETWTLHGELLADGASLSWTS